MIMITTETKDTHNHNMQCVWQPSPEDWRPLTGPTQEFEEFLLVLIDFLPPEETSSLFSLSQLSSKRDS